MAMLFLDYVYNSPITSVLATNLANAMKIRRMKNEMLEDEGPEKQAMMKQAANERVQRNRWQVRPSLLSDAHFPVRIVGCEPSEPTPEHSSFCHPSRSRPSFLCARALRPT